MNPLVPVSMLAASGGSKAAVVVGAVLLQAIIYARQPKPTTAPAQQ